MNKHYLYKCNNNFLEQMKVDKQNWLIYYKEANLDIIKESFYNDQVIERLSNYSFEYKPLVFDNIETENDFIIKNTPIIYNSLKEIPIGLATDEAFWVTTMNIYYLDFLMDYTIGHKLDDLSGFLFFLPGNQRLVINNTLSLLWWIGYHLYDDSNSDPYIWLKLLNKNNINIKRLIYDIHPMRITSINGLLHGVLEAFISFKDEKVINLKNINDVLLFFNLLGGTHVLDLWSKKNFKRVAMEYIESRILKNE